MRHLAFLAVCALGLTGCGYHVAGKADLLPEDIRTIAILPFTNVSMQYKLSDYLAESVSRELITRTKYRVIADPAKADAVLTGAVANLFSSAIVSDPVTARSTGVQMTVLIQAKLVDNKGKVLFARPNIQFNERYEISVDPRQYFDESGPALQRLGNDVAKEIVSAILENF